MLYFQIFRNLFIVFLGFIYCSVEYFEYVYRVILINIWLDRNLLFIDGLLGSLVIFFVYFVNILYF